MVFSLQNSWQPVHFKAVRQDDNIVNSRPVDLPLPLASSSVRHTHLLASGAPGNTEMSSNGISLKFEFPGEVKCRVPDSPHFFFF
ncbi:hypothetical protein RRG08_023986 [Elysia crispata]|uniref:Uncharacterized protein n=1 Tax=Elysia crispata TaxID=231223 RepID=A0AAE1D1E8_9GAST|nr:hypothetical protein RRG08_023986 [Elysia crispata]